MSNPDAIRSFRRPRRSGPPYILHDGFVEIRCPNDYCDRHHTDHAPITPGDTFRWSCPNCKSVMVRLPDDLFDEHEAA